MPSDRRLDRIEAINRRRRQAGVDPIRYNGASPVPRVGALTSTSRLAKTIEHNRGIRRRLIAAIHVAPERAGLNGARLTALLLRLTGESDPSNLVLDQLRRVLGELRKQASPRSVEPSRGVAAAGGWERPPPHLSPSSTPKEDT